MKDKKLYEIIENLVTLAALPGNERHIEVNRISWFGKEPKIDIRGWNKDRSECGKGITMSEEEYKQIIEIGGASHGQDFIGTKADQTEGQELCNQN